MAYLGRGLDRGNYLKLDDISSQFNGSTTTFNLTSGGTAFYPGSALSILVSVAGIVQEPESAYQINQNQIIFATAPQASDDFFCIVLGVPLAVGVAANSTITGTQLSKPFNYNEGHLYFDSVNNRLGINSTSPRQELDIRGSAIISGNLSVGGTITYEDVTNIDSIGVITARTGIDVLAGGINAAGVITATGGFNIGIQSGGIDVATGVITALNFIGVGNTFIYNSATKTVNISIQGGVGAGGTWNANNVGVYTGKSVGINTNNITGTANSEGALQVVGNVALVDGALLTDQNIDSNVFVPSGKNGLLIGPVTVGIGVTVDIATGSVLVIV